MANKNFEIKNGLEVGNGLINVSSGDVSIRRGMSTTNRIRIESANIYADTNLTVAGNLTVQGDTTTLNVGTLDVEDKNITLNKGSGDTSGSANGAGITIQDAVDASTDATLLWNSSTDFFEFSHGLVMDNASNILLERGGELRSLDTGGSTRTIARINGSNDLEYGYSGSGAVKFMGGGSYTERMRVHSDGKVGIGTSSPAVLLHVESTSIPQMRVAYNGSNYQNLSYEGSDIIGGSHVFKISGSEKMRLATTGNLGIGTTSPGTSLQIGDGTGDEYITIDKSATGASGILFKNAGNNKVKLLCNSAEEFELHVNNALKMYVKENGNVGIGTSSPNRKLNLHVAANDSNFTQFTNSTTGEVGSNGFLVGIGSAGNAELWNYEAQPIIFATSGTERARIDSSGNVGIGVSSPSTMLHMNGTGDMIRLESTNSGAGGAQMDMLHFSASPADGDTQAAINMGGYYSGTSSAYFAAIRCVGTNVGGKEGKLAFYTRDDSSFAQRFAITHTGVLETLMGVGSDNVALGNGALSSSSFNGDNVTAIGQNAGAAHTTGIRCTYVGNDAGDACTTGNDNTAVGQGALSTNQTGNNNTAVGRAALNASTSSNNTAVGYHALLNLSSGTQNNAFGQASMSSLTTGNYNCGFGQATLNSLQDGVGNVAVGDNAMQFGTSQDYCVAVGENAGRYNTANNGVFIGAGAGDSNTSGDKNTFVGREAGTACSTGHNNVFVGGSAGYDATDANNNVFVGVNTQNDNAGTSNQVVIGYSARSQGSGKFTVGTSNTSTYSTLTIGGTSWSGSSDERLKKEITNSTAGLSFINDLRPVTFKWKTRDEVDSTLPHYEEGSDEPVIGQNVHTKHGFIAQEVKTVIDNHTEVKDGSEIWEENRDGIQNFSPTALIPMLVKSIQELKAKNDALEARIETLEG